MVLYHLYPISTYDLILYIISSRTGGGAPLSLQDTRPRQGAAGFPGTPPRRSPWSETDPAWMIIPGSSDVYSQRNRQIRNHYFKSMLIYFIAGIIFNESMFFDLLQDVASLNWHNPILQKMVDNLFEDKHVAGKDRKGKSRLCE